MDLEETKKLKEYLEKIFPNKKYWVLDPNSQTEAEMQEILREIKKYKKETDESKGIFLN